VPSNRCTSFLFVNPEFQQKSDFATQRLLGPSRFAWPFFDFLSELTAKVLNSVTFSFSVSVRSQQP
jgi:hypothetical protein